MRKFSFFLTFLAACSDPAGDAAPDAADAGPSEPGANWQPSPGTSWQWQLTGDLDTDLDVAMFDVDPDEVGAEAIQALQAVGRVVICYFSAGTHEPWRDDAADFPAGAIGDPLPDWPDERWLDTRDAAVRGVLTARLDRAAALGCDGVEPDNVDAYANESGFPLSAETQLDFNRFLAREAHARGLSVGLKNDLDQIEDLVADFDWALNEECFAYDECELLLPFIRAGKAVFQVEYGEADLAPDVCPRANALDFDTLIKSFDLDAWRVACR